MSSLEDVVRSVVEGFVNKSELFTALDVSNDVKAVLPNVRHREIRDVVRDLFITDVESQGYTRTPITVSLDDGTTATALLYHPLSDAWDLDNKYDAQKRAQTSSHPVAAAQAAVQAAQQSSTLSSNTTPTCTATPVLNTTSATITASVVVPMPTARQLWDQMFQTQPSLFPKR